MCQSDTILSKCLKVPEVPKHTMTRLCTTKHPPQDPILILESETQTLVKKSTPHPVAMEGFYSDSDYVGSSCQ